ncbi:metallophosphoesterase [Leptolyngbya sp. 'hensonii']|uniref:metallophosphoesterase n=1 Tax=Leptolyngbya sp. 'hensonii' TaxID=1922337 RepID=UPI00209A7240|nr:metallophosphoesterase [Leptolyngbya sp. 'hensonii']
MTVPIMDLPQTWQGARVVQLSDFHYDGVRLSESLLAEAIAATNAMKPLLVFLTGDFVTDLPNPIHLLIQRLKLLQSQLGIYAVLGNHDLYYPRSRREITTALQSIGITVLWNDIAYPGSGELAIVGLADFWSPEFDPAPVFDRLPSHLPRIVLSHNPDSAMKLKRWRVDLQLSGHTHGGQIVLPGMQPLPAYATSVMDLFPKDLRHWLPCIQISGKKVIHHWEWSQGFHQIGSNTLYVNRGLGTYYPGRLFCPPEVTVLTLVKQEQQIAQTG